MIPIELIRVALKILEDNKVDNYCDYYDHLKKRIKDFRDTIKRLEGNNIIAKGIKDSFENDKDVLYKIYRNVLKGKLQSASTSMSNILFGKKNWLEPLKMTIPKSTVFYRCRKKVDDSKPFENEMFHIPFDMRYKVGNERFSISGFPCLYLASSPACAKKEIGGTEGGILAKFTLQQDVECYDLSLKEEYYGEDIKTFYRIFLLILFCSVQIKDKKDDNAKFFPYYVIPQLVTSAVASQSKDCRNIRYQSTKYSDGYNYLFIPVLGDLKKKDRQDKALMKKFSIEIYKE